MQINLFLLWLAGKKAMQKLLGKPASHKWCWLGKRHPRDGSWLATSFNKLLLAGCAERVLFSHDR